MLIFVDFRLVILDVAAGIVIVCSAVLRGADSIHIQSLLDVAAGIVMSPPA